MKNNIKKYLGEGFLIVFSVLFALFIDKTVEDYKTKQNKNIAKESILKELHRNQEIINNWKIKHDEMNKRISAMIDNEKDSLRIELKKNNFLDLMVLTNNQSFIDAILSDTAWESAKTTGIISEFDYNKIQILTQVYDLQKILTERTIMNTMDYYYETESHNMDNLDKTLILFSLRLWELTGQESSMLFLYDKAIEELENR